MKRIGRVRTPRTRNSGPKRSEGETEKSAGTRTTPRGRSGPRGAAARSGENASPSLIELVKVGLENLAECGIGCIANPEHPGFAAKSAWLKERFAEGLRLLLIRGREGKPLAFLEYVPGRYAWRPVDANDWLFVHCLWVFPAGQAVAGLGSRLIRACLDEARRLGARGVAAVVSEGPWMAGEAVFLKNGFVRGEQRGRFEVVAFPLKKAPAPRFRDPSPKWGRHKGLGIVTSAQCPYLLKSTEDVTALAAEHGLEAKVTVLKSATEAQEAPSTYGVFNLLWNGKVLSDHYVSRGRFRNILKEIKGRGASEPLRPRR
jgi:L-amino acid N-acyltransferase YncA